MGIATSACVKRGGDGDDGGDGCCGKRPAVTRVRFAEDVEEEQRLATDRDNVLNFFEAEDTSMRRHLTRFFTMAEIVDLESFNVMLKETEGGRMKRSNTLIDEGYGPWGIADQKGGSDNAWDDISGWNYQVRGPKYQSDKKKVQSEERLLELLVVDLFMSDTDVANVAACLAAKTVQRLRRDGETRKLLVLNFRIVPLHLVCVWAVPPDLEKQGTPAAKLLASFVGGMSDGERNSRLKIIPRILQGPWPVRKLVGENSPAILGKGIPVSYFSSANELEISVSIAASSAAQRISRVMLRAGTAIDIELALLIEGQAEEELPEQIMGGLRLARAQLGSVRTVDPASGEGVSPAPSRPAGLPCT